MDSIRKLLKALLFATVIFGSLTMLFAALITYTSLGEKWL